MRRPEFDYHILVALLITAVILLGMWWDCGWRVLGASGIDAGGFVRRDAGSIPAASTNGRW